jgi:peptidylprolyl isomerase
MDKVNNNLSKLRKIMKILNRLGSQGSEHFGRVLRSFAIAIVGITLSISLCGAGWRELPPSSSLLAVLAQGNAITDPQAILRNALPIDNKTIRKAQGSIEDIANHLRGKRWNPIAKDVKDAFNQITNRSDDILATIPSDRQGLAQDLLSSLKIDLEALKASVDAQDNEQVGAERRSILNQITQLEELMVTNFPFEVPSDYANLPQLKGRATVEIKTTQGDLTVVVDGYSAPVNAGNFVDLVNRGFYNGLPFLFSGDDFVLQTGDPIGSEEGFIDPKTKKYRAVPLEILINGDEEPVYGLTLEEIGIYLPSLALPFNAYGAVAMARPSTDPNGGSSQFFFFKFDNELTPPGFNLMDGRYTVFGYLVEGREALDKLTDKDKILSAKVVSGLENLVQPQA